MDIRIDDVSYQYPDGTWALNGVSLQIQPGERLALIGANGAGKTTLVRHLNGLLLPTSGEVWVGEWNTRRQPVAFLARWVGYAFQNPDDQIFCQTVWKEVAFGPRNLHLSETAVQERVEQALALTGLTGQEQVNPFDLSWPWRRRIAVASILAMDPAFLILDEPTAGQDQAGLDLMANLIRIYNQRGKAVIGITHDMDFCAEHFERMIVLDRGQVAFDGPITGGLTHPEMLYTSGLGLPQVERLGKALGFSMPVKNIEDFLGAYRRWKKPAGNEMR